MKKSNDIELLIHDVLEEREGDIQDQLEGIIELLTEEGLLEDEEELYDYEENNK